MVAPRRSFGCLPLCRATVGAPECLTRTVRLPERFRGGIAPSAPRPTSSTGDSPVQECQHGPIYRPMPREMTAARRLERQRAESRGCGADQPVLRAARRAASSSPASRLGVGLGGALGRQLGEGALDLRPDTADRDAEDALAALEQVDDLVVAGALVDRDAVAHQRDAGQVVGAALAQVLDGGADLLQRDAGVEQTLDDLEQQDVLEGVEPLRAGALGAADGGLDQAGAGPVVELAVGDAGGVARGRAAVAGVAGQRGDVVGEEQALLLRRLGSQSRLDVSPAAARSRSRVLRRLLRCA